MCSSCDGSNASQQYTCNVSSFSVPLRKFTRSPNLFEPSIVKRGCLKGINVPEGRRGTDSFHVDLHLANAEFSEASGNRTAAAPRLCHGRLL
mmetsp:Transcript_46604/g.107633  ORF Transcript_46604/g.107633 Transcript_46604/m.107633 type:complete len:92 (-) Transcript_46604:50-325(-)